MLNTDAGITSACTYVVNQLVRTYYAPPLGGGIKRCFCLTSDVWLSVCRVHRP